MKIHFHPESRSKIWVKYARQNNTHNYFVDSLRFIYESYSSREEMQSLVQKPNIYMYGRCRAFSSNYRNNEQRRDR